MFKDIPFTGVCPWEARELAGIEDVKCQNEASA